MGNGNRAQQRRDRQVKNAPGAAKSQLKQNEAAREYQCSICKSTFLKTANLGLLTEHALNRHKTGAEECFDRLPEETAKEKAKRLAKEAEEAKKAEMEEAKRLAKELAAKKKAEEEEEEARKKAEEGEKVDVVEEGGEEKEEGEEEKTEETEAKEEEGAEEKKD